MQTQITVMDAVLDQPWRTESFLAWEDQQQGRHEFDELVVLPITHGTVAYQEIVFNLRVLLARLLAGTSLRALQEMRLRIGEWVRYYEVLVSAGPSRKGSECGRCGGDF